MSTCISFRVQKVKGEGLETRLDIASSVLNNSWLERRR